jgi:hypothetical protein
MSRRLVLCFFCISLCCILYGKRKGETKGSPPPTTTTAHITPPQEQLLIAIRQGSYQEISTLTNPITFDSARPYGLLCAAYTSFKERAYHDARPLLHLAIRGIKLTEAEYKGILDTDKSNLEKEPLILAFLEYIYYASTIETSTDPSKRKEKGTALFNALFAIKGRIIPLTTPNYFDELTYTLCAFKDSIEETYEVEDTQIHRKEYRRFLIEQGLKK